MPDDLDAEPNLGVNVPARFRGPQTTPAPNLDPAASGVNVATGSRVLTPSGSPFSWPGCPLIFVGQRSGNSRSVGGKRRSMTANANPLTNKGTQRLSSLVIHRLLALRMRITRGVRADVEAKRGAVQRLGARSEWPSHRCAMSSPNGASSACATRCQVASEPRVVPCSRLISTVRDKPVRSASAS
jgi:hypothetical protein